MSSASPLTFTLDLRLLRHPRAYHLRRMRMGLWLYLDLLARLPGGTETTDVDPAVIGTEMGLPEGTVRAWLGHLRAAGYVKAQRLNGKVRVTFAKGFVPEPAAPTPTPAVRPERIFSVEKLQRMLKDSGNTESFQAALKLYPDAIIRRAVAGALAPPDEQIRRSRTALFLFLLKRHDPHHHQED